MKTHKLISSKKLTSPAGVKEVSFGQSTVDRRLRRDFSKDGIKEVDSKEYDDVKERSSRWGLNF